MLEQRYNLIGSYWERNNMNEIDIVAVDDLNKKILIAEVKRNPDNISIGLLNFSISSTCQAYSSLKMLLE